MNVIDTTVYNPESIVENMLAELLRRAPFTLRRFDLKEAGVYLLFYKGRHPYYRLACRSIEATLPIYVGKTSNLGVRLSAHFKTINATDLDVGDFMVRVLPLPETWSELAEKVLIQRHLVPVWNCPEWAGFGNDGSPRASGSASKWDVLHPAQEGRRVGKTTHPNEKGVRQNALQVLAQKADQRTSEGWVPPDDDAAEDEEAIGGGGLFELFGV